MGAAMAKRRKERIEQDEVVRLFAGRLKEVRRSRGLTQMELSRQAQVTASYIWRLESGGAAPGIDLVARLARALGTTTHDLLPATAPPDTSAMLLDQARALFNALLAAADRETLLMLNPLLARLVEASERSR
jgi:transcriptional regulator with XRE-family HTH domain